MNIITYQFVKFVQRLTISMTKYTDNKQGYGISSHQTVQQPHLFTHKPPCHVVFHFHSCSLSHTYNK